MLRRGVITAILTLALLTVLASPLNDPQVTVPYTVQGGFSTSYETIPYVTEASVGVTKPVASSYTSIAGVSTSYTPMVYRINTELVVRGITWSTPLRIHVRLLKANKTYIPDFDVDYTVNGTQRTARKGEDSFNLTLNYFVTYWDPVILVFPDTVEGHKLLNSTTITIDPFTTPDVYVYYYAEVTEPIKPTAPTTPETTPSGGTPMFPRGYIFIPWWLIEFIESYWWLLILTVMLIIVLYRYLRHREGVSIEIEIPKWAY